MKTDSSKKHRNMIIGFFFLALMIIFAGLTIRDYVYYKDGMIVQGTVTSVSTYHSRRRTRYKATVVVTINGKEMTEKIRFPLSTSINVNGVSTSQGNIKKGDQVNMVAVIKEDGTYDIALSDDVLEPGKNLTIIGLIIALILFGLIKIHKRGVQQTSKKALA